MGLSGSAPRSDGLKDRLRTALCAAARRRAPVTYRDLAQALELAPPNTIHQLTEFLEVIMAEDAAAERPFVAALAVSKARRGLPAPGFFACAQRLGRLRDADEPLDAAGYHAQELAAAIDYWHGSGPWAAPGGR